MTRRISALEGYYHKGVFGKKDNLSVVITEVRNLILYQVAVWPDTLNDVGKKIAESLNLPEFPEANKGFSTNEVSMLRLEPLKWWVIGREILEIAAEEGSGGVPLGGAPGQALRAEGACEGSTLRAE